VSIDVSGLERLLGPARAIGDELRRTAQSRGVQLHVAVARTRTAAVVLALARPGVTIVERGGEAEALATVPIGILEKFDDDAKPRPSTRAGCPERVEGQSPFAVLAVEKWGLTTLGELAALPPADLVSRLGPRVRTWQAIARGEDVRPLIPTLPEERFVSTLELEWPIEELEPLSFVLTRLLEPLSTRLERRDRGAAVLHLVLRLVNKDTCARRLELPSPIRDVRTLRTLALLDLEAHPPSAAIDRVTIVIDPTPGRVLQHTLFTRAHPTPEQLSTLLARLGALMGHDRFGAPAVVDSYRPGAFELKPFKTDHDDQRGVRRDRGKKDSGNLHLENPDSASSAVSALIVMDTASNVVSGVRRCRHPVPARVAVDNGRPVRVTTDRRGFAGGAVVRCVGPWRTSGEWWNADTRKSQKSEVRSQKSEVRNPEALQTSDFRLQTSHVTWNRDEWDVSLDDGAMYRIFRDRESDTWWIDAIAD
jgi:protein ImuB